MAPSATDIITYIGVPLAVLGVMPVLYTFVRALLTQNHVRHSLRKNNMHHAATTSTSLMSGEVQLQLPRYTLTPPLRDSNDYWSREELPSSLKGGTWTLFRWRKMVTGKVKYGLQLHDEIRQPAAEIEFEGLVTFLLDRGAVPDADGVRMLKTMGLMTPKNTPILVVANERGGTAGGTAGAKRSVLVVSSPDDSEGHLVLKLFWSDHLMQRDVQALPPYWTRLASFQTEASPERLSIGGIGDEKERLQAEEIAKGKETKEIKDEQPKQSEETAGKDEQPVEENATKEAAEESVTEETSDKRPQTPTSTFKSVRMYIGPTGLEDARLETPDGRLDSSGTPFSFPHLRPASSPYPPSYHASPIPPPTKTYASNMSLWFPIFAITVLGQGHRGLWRYTIPPAITQFAHRDSVPHGVLVHLTLLAFEETPLSEARARARREREMQRQHEEMRANMQAMRDEEAMPPHLRDAARGKRNMDTAWKMGQRMQNERMEREREALDRKEEALVSPRVNNGRVSEACLRYLQQLPPPNKAQEPNASRDDRSKWKTPHDKHPVFSARNKQEIAEYALHRMMFDGDFAESLCTVLDKWKAWSEAGVMNDRELDELHADLVGFCFAGVLLDIVKERAGDRENWAGQDLADVQVAWRSVWLE